jgi:hypothetical protein
MARAVYSTRFLSLGIEGTNVSYIVPAGYVAVVRAIDMVYLGGPTAAAGFVELGGALVPVALLLNVNGNDQAHIQTRQVVNAGDPIKIIATTLNTCYISVSGYLLTLP